jgi:hypothetical protein
MNIKHSLAASLACAALVSGTVPASARQLEDLQAIAPAAAVATSCGVQKSTRIVTEDTLEFTETFGWGNAPSGSTTVTLTDTDCVVVTFSASSACLIEPGNSDDGCFVRVLRNGTVMRPTGGVDGVGFAGENIRSHAHSMQWIARLAPGTYRIQVQWRTDGGGTRFVLGARTLSVSVLQ